MVTYMLNYLINKMITILLASYNGERYIKEAIESILNQTFTDFEILIGLNGTTDSTRNIIDSFDDDRIRLIDYGSDKGKSITLNKLLHEAKYDILAMMDDDDIWLPNKLEMQIKLIQDYDIVGTNLNYIDSEGVFIGGEPVIHSDDNIIKYLAKIGDNQIVNSSSIFKKADAISIGGWRTDIEGIEDYAFWITLMKNDKKFINIPDRLVLHRLHKNSNFNTKSLDLGTIL